MAKKFYERWDLMGEAALTGTAGYISATSGMRAVSAQARVGVAESVQAAKTAQQLRDSIPDIKLEADQRHQDVVRELSDWMAVAGATAGYMNMSDNTLDALTSRVTADAAETSSRITLQATREKAKRLTEAETMSRAGIVSAESALEQAKIGKREVYAQALGTAASLFRTSFRDD